MKRTLKFEVILLTLFCFSFFTIAESRPAYEISAGQSISVSVYPGNPAILKFEPVVSGEYCFTSESNYHTVGFVLDESMNLLAASGESSGESSNFLLNHTFCAGKTYYLQAALYLENISTSFNVKLTLVAPDPTHIHSYKAEISKFPTCEESGEVTYSCICSHSFKKELAATGHCFETYRSEPTCTQGGKIISICSVCKKVSEKTLPALSHRYYEQFIVDKEPSCTSAGSKSYHCIRCEKRTNIIEIQALGHDYSDWEEKTSPTCTKGGTEVRVCSLCQSTKSRSTEALGHKYSKSFSIDTAASCTKSGQKSRHCSRCKSVTGKTVIPAAGHKYGKFKITKKPSCTKSGEKARTCTVCARIQKKSISKTGHSYSKSWTTDKKADFYSSGQKSRHCKKCSKRTDVKTIPKISKVSLSSNRFVYNSKTKRPRLTVKCSNGLVLKEKRDYTVKIPKKSKNIGQYKITVTLTGSYSGKKTLYYKIVPQDILFLNAKTTSNTTRLSWPKVSGNVKYRVYKYYQQSKKYVVVANTEKTTCKITGLKFETPYIFAVRAYKTVGSKSFFSPNFVCVNTRTDSKNR